MTPKQEELLKTIIDELEEEAKLRTVAAALETRNTMQEEYRYLSDRANQHAARWIKAVEELTGKTLEELYQ